MRARRLIESVTSTTNRSADEVRRVTTNVVPFEEWEARDSLRDLGPAAHLQLVGDVWQREGHRGQCDQSDDFQMVWRRRKPRETDVHDRLAAAVWSALFDLPTPRQG